MVSRSRGIDGALLCGIGLASGSVALVAPYEIALAAVASAIVARAARRIRWTGVVLFCLAVAFGSWRASADVAVHETQRFEADQELPAPERCSARARVDSSPVRVRGALRWDARLSGVECDGKATDWTGRATLYGGLPDLARGDEVDVVATLAPPERFWNAGTGDPRPALAHRDVSRTGGTLDVRVVRRARGLGAWIDRARARIRARIDATFPEALDAMTRALVLGESDLDPDDDRSFRASGLSHLLAVSGMHLVLVVGLFVRVLEGILVRVERLAATLDVGRVVAAAAVPAAWLYAELAGAGGSTLRAAWMATAAFAARAAGRRPDATRSFGLSLVAMAVVDPLVAFDVSFALSAGATAGLLSFAGPMSERLASWVPRRAAPLSRAVATTLAASIPCVPMVARFAPTVPLGGVVANLVAVPIGECAALPLCLLHAAMAWWPSAERGCAATAAGALVVVRQVARWASVPALTASVPQPTSWQFAVISVLLAAAVLPVPRRRLLFALGAVSLVSLEVVARRAGAPRGVLRATFLDVGQGDAAIVDLPDGEAMVVDGGGLVGSPIDVGQRVLGPELRSRRREELAAVVLTHPHPDHFGGLVTGLDGVRVSALWDTGEGEAEGTGGGYARLLSEARDRGTAVLRPDGLCGRHAIGGATIEVLAPCPAFSSDRGPNDNSFVLRITFGARSLLLVGDAEHEEERILLDGAHTLRADVLKVGHHGSRTSSTPAFLAAVDPLVAIVSVGRRNRFGHPSPVTTAALDRAGAQVFRTDRHGAVVVTTDGRTLSVASEAGH